MEEYQQYRNEMTERNQEMNEVCQVKQRQLENMSQELQYYQEEREKTDRRIVEATNFIQTSATRARTMSRNLAKLKEKIVIVDTPEANLSAYLDGIIHYKEITFLQRTKSLQNIITATTIVAKSSLHKTSLRKVSATT
ncbi:hypothetical protein M5689_006596 [Euphorbia peplus]|nr:hypothetical protein M5689_006596 [Euphorbia peplus]